MNLNQIQAPIQAELVELEQCVADRLDASIPLIQTICEHLINSGGKRLRPSVVLLSAGCFGPIIEQQLDLALIIEFIHTATLLHDDVVDESALRRGQQTANAVWGNQASVLVGDFLLARSFQLLVKLDDMALMDLLAKTTQEIAAGEILQLTNQQNPNTTTDSYLEVIRCKTAALFAAASQGATMLASRDPKQHNAAYEFGLNFGMAFQLIDDALDYATNNNELGKNAGDDLAEGKPTLPLLYALEHGSQNQQTLIQQAISNADRNQFETVVEIIEQTAAIDYTRHVAMEYAQKAEQALMQLPENSHRQSLAALLKFAVERQY